MPLDEQINDAQFRSALAAMDAGEVQRLAALLQDEPDLIRRRVNIENYNYFRHPSLLEFVAENPIRHGRMPPNVVGIATLLLEAGPEQATIDATLELIATSRIAREGGFQEPLLALLCRFGVDPNKALHAAAAHRESDALRQLLQLGGRLDVALAVALDDAVAFQRLLPMASSPERHLALAFAAQYGRTDMLKVLLDAGEDVNRFNPSGAHGHSTPLHQAVCYGHTEAVCLLLARGARQDLRDTNWHGTALDWAKHCELPEMVKLLQNSSHLEK